MLVGSELGLRMEGRGFESRIGTGVKATTDRLLYQFWFIQKESKRKKNIGGRIWHTPKKPLHKQTDVDHENKFIL